MSRKGNCYDNAPMESFWGTLKNELVHHRRYKTREEASGRSPNTSRSSTIGNGGKHGWVIYPRLSMKGSSMQGGLQHERIVSCPLLTSGVTYIYGGCRLTASTFLICYGNRSHTSHLLFIRSDVRPIRSHPRTSEYLRRPLRNNHFQFESAQLLATRAAVGSVFCL